MQSLVSCFVSVLFSHQTGRAKQNDEPRSRNERTEVAFTGAKRKVFSLAVCLQQDKGGMHLDKESIRIVFHGDPAAVQFSDEEQRIFYEALLTRILDLYRQEQEQQQKQERK